MLIEAILAGFLTFGLPPATTPVKACTNWSKRVGCSVNTGGARPGLSVKDASDRNRAARDRLGGKGEGGNSTGRGSSAK